MKSVDKGQCVRLQSNPCCGQADGTAGRRCPTGRLAVQYCGELGNRGIIKPVSVLHMKPKQVRVQLLADGDEVRHERSPNLASEQSNDVEERGKCECILWL